MKTRLEEHRNVSRSGKEFIFGRALSDLKKVLEKILQADRRRRGHLPPVLMHGETGTGKTTVARWLHQIRHGHLLDGRYKAKLVSGDEYLLKLSRYIHQNLVRDGSWESKPLKERTRYLREYRWSSYRLR